MLSQAMAQRIEHRSLGELKPYLRNPRTHSDAQIAQIAGSILAFGFNSPILIDSKGNIIAGHGRYLAALKLGLETVPVIVLDHLSEIEKRAYLLADNKLAELSGWEDETLASELAELRDAEIELGGLGFSDDELRVLLADADLPGAEGDQEEEIPEAPTEPVTRAGDIWCVADHRLICGDCRDRDVVQRLFGGARANLVVTSPPYATQREYDPGSGFMPVPPEAYCDWFRVVAANIAPVLAPDGSYLLNIKPHADDGERNLYVMDLVLAHKRQWGWRFVDEFCWRKTDNGVPGGWGMRQVEPSAANRRTRSASHRSQRPGAKVAGVVGILGSPGLPLHAARTARSAHAGGGSSHDVVLRRPGFAGRSPPAGIRAGSRLSGAFASLRINLGCQTGHGAVMAGERGVGFSTAPGRRPAHRKLPI